MKKTLALTATALVFAVSSVANAATVTFTGDLTNQGDVDIHSFIVTNSSSVRFWTDSFENGINFDPILRIFNSANTLVAYNDDNSSVGPNQTVFDSGIVTTLAAGTYSVAISTCCSLHRNGDINAVGANRPLTRGSFYRINIEGDVASALAVPDASTTCLFGTGLAVLAVLRRKVAA